MITNKKTTPDNLNRSANFNRDGTIKVCFVFGSKGIGGAERSMLRLMESAHTNLLSCAVIVCNEEDTPFTSALSEIAIPFHNINGWRLDLLRKHFIDINPDIVYLFSPTKTIFWAIIARLANVRVVIGAERSTARRWTDLIFRSFDKYILDAYICNSRNACQTLEIDLRIPASRIFLVYNGIDLNDDLAVNEITPAITGYGYPLVVCVANINPQKGQSVLLKAIQHLQVSYPSICAILVGDDQTEGAFFRQVDANGLKNTYHWIGFSKDVRGFLVRSTVFVLPSLHREGTPTSILEAMAMGVPVVASDVGGVGEIVSNNENGILVPPNEPLILSEKIRWLIDSPEARSKIVTNAKIYVEENHSLRKMVTSHVDIFRKLLREKN